MAPATTTSIRLRDGVLLGVFAAAVALGLSVWVHFANGATPLVLDEVAFLWEAKQLGTGHLTAPAPKHPESVNISFLTIVDGRRFSMYPIGYSLALVPWVLAGVPWGLNVLLGTLSLVLLFDFARRNGGRAIAWTSAVLLAISPFFITQSTIYMTHPLLLVLTLIVLLSLSNRERAPERLRWPVLCGAAIGYMVNVTPFAGASVGLAAVTRALRLRRSVPIRRPDVLVFALPVLLGALLFLGVNWKTTGQPLVPGYYLDPTVRAGFGEEVGPKGHSAERAMAQTLWRITLLDRFLFAWPLTSFLFAVPYLLILGAIRLRAVVHRSSRVNEPSGWTIELLVLFISNLVVYMFWYFHGNGPTWGPRYLYHTIIGPVLITAQGMVAAARLLRGAWSRRPPLALFGGALPFLLAGFLTIEGAVPRLHRVWKHNFLRMRRADGEFLRGLEEKAIRQGTIFVDLGSIKAFHSLPGLLWASDCDERAPLVFARNLGPRGNAEFLKTRREGPVFYAWLDDEAYRWHLVDKLPSRRHK